MEEIENERWRAEVWEKYSFLCDSWVIETGTEQNKFWDDWRFSTWNYFKENDKDSITAYRKKIKEIHFDPAYTIKTYNPSDKVTEDTLEYISI